MKKMRLKKWVENTLYIIEALLIFMLLAVVEKNITYLIINKVIGITLFCVCAYLLINYSRDEED